MCPDTYDQVCPRHRCAHICDQMVPSVRGGVCCASRTCEGRCTCRVCPLSPERCVKRPMPATQSPTASTHGLLVCNVSLICTPAAENGGRECAVCMRCTCRRCASGAHAVPVPARHQQSRPRPPRRGRCPPRWVCARWRPAARRTRARAPRRRRRRRRRRAPRSRACAPPRGWSPSPPARPARRRRRRP